MGRSRENTDQITTISLDEGRAPLGARIYPRAASLGDPVWKYGSRPRRGGGIGRRNGLKIRWDLCPVWVRVPPPALLCVSKNAPERRCMATSGAFFVVDANQGLSPLTGKR